VSATPGKLGPRNKLWDANLGNWPRVLERAEDLHPLHVLPGHGAAGGEEILKGEKRFLEDLVAVVAEQVKAGKKLAEMRQVLPDRDRDWAPGDLTTDFSIAYAEITQHQPAGALPHVWK
jgi:hypothetical protein